MNDLITKLDLCRKNSGKNRKLYGIKLLHQVCLSFYDILLNFFCRVFLFKRLLSPFIVFMKVKFELRSGGNG